ncbi:MAG: hypothetical protein J6V66_03395 [Clostridia bacterium]|nr:hypothetical protein [Clostridia bacterium]
MENFGLFDTIKNLSALKKSAESILPLIKSVATPKESQPKNEEDNKAHRPSVAPALAYIKRHEEMSKRIDKKR